MANGFAARDASGNTVELVSKEVVQAALGITGQEQVIIIADSAGQNLLAVDSSGRLSVAKSVGAGKTLQQKAISVSSSGDNTIVSLVSSKSIYVVSYTLVVTSAVSAAWKSSGGAALSGGMPFAANGGASPKGSIEEPLFWTVSGEALVLNLGSAVAVGGHLTYFAE